MTEEVSPNPYFDRLDRIAACDYRLDRPLVVIDRTDPLEPIWTDYAVLTADLLRLRMQPQHDWGTVESGGCNTRSVCLLRSAPVTCGDCLRCVSGVESDPRATP